MLIRSLYTQVILALILLGVTTSTQLLLSRSDIQVLQENQNAITDSYNNLTHVYDLERDVVDLQRNLLIYKVTGSESSGERFFSIMGQVIGDLEVFKKRSENNANFEQYQTIITGMFRHLIGYQENFINVIDSRAQRDDLKKEVESYIKKISDQSIDKFPIGSNKLSEIKFYLAAITRSLYQYLHQPDLDYITEFKTRLASLKLLIQGSENTETLLPLINNLSKRFVRLTHVTRGYTFLINVVMAGSANEFLYLSEKLKIEVEKDKDQLILFIEKSAHKILFINNIELGVSIFIMLLIAWFLSQRILIPINDITEVFRILSKGDEVDRIPGAERSDEVGDLAKAAEVFHKKNNLTHELLERSQDMIANQEVMNILLETEKDKAQQAAKAKSMFLANMSHEIRTPMNGIVGLVDLVLKTKLDEKQKNYLNRIAYSGQIMMNVINDILDFSKIEAGKMEIEQVEFNINTVIENLISAMDVRINEKNLNFIVVVNKRVPSILIGDPLRISQVLLNLCSNSVKFTEQGLIEINLDYQNNFLEIEVKDTGIGMTENQAASIFQSFTQADGTTSRKHGGTGLGLTIVKQLIELMHGEINLSSEFGKGTQVNVKIKAKNSVASKNIFELGQPANSILYTFESLNAITEVLLDNLSLGVTKLSFDKFNASIDGPILIEAKTFDALKGLSLEIDSLVNSGEKIGFILQTNNNEIRDFISANWELPVLQHPFSPAQCTAYISTLCMDKSADNTTLSHQQHSEDQALALYEGHVLLVEDNDINQLVAGDMLEGLGLTFDVVDNGQKCLDAVISEKQYDIIFMDVQMPIMDGYTATRELRQRGYSQLVICGLSANALKEDLEMAKQVGMTEYLTKPLQIKSLENLVKKYLASRT
jgi:signal transduction histidine kinase